MDLLVVGAGGLLGSNVVAVARQRGWNVSGTFHSTRPALNAPLLNFDLRNHAAFGDVLDRYRPDVVVNCAAMTDVDACENNHDRAYTVNGEAPGSLAAVCTDRDTDFVHVSTDYVFDGTADTPYVETDDPTPTQVYGESKLAGERAVRDAAKNALVARLSFVWGIHRGHGSLAGFPAWVRDRVRDGETTPLFTDQWITPTRAGQAARTLLELLQQSANGRYHVACKTCTTPYAFGKRVIDLLGTGVGLLEQGSMDDVDRPAARPRYTCLDIENVETTLGRPQPTLRDDLAAARSAL